MKTLVLFLLTLALIVPCAALAEETPLRIGYITRFEEEGGRYTLCADAFAYAAEQQGVELTVLTYDLAAKEIPEDADGEEQPLPGMAELLQLIDEGVDAVVLAPASLDQAVELIGCASEAGMPIIIEGMDVSPAYPPAPEAAAGEESDPAGNRPYAAAIGYGDSAAYAAAMWLEDDAYNPQLFHCALPQSDPAIQAGLRRAQAEASYLALVMEINANSDSAQAGSDAVDEVYNSYTTFGCVLADSAALAEGSANSVHGAGDNYPIAAISTAQEALALLENGRIDLAASTPASVEGVQTFKLIFDYLTEGILPETETGFVQLDAILVSRSDTTVWVADDDFETAYALAFPESAEAEEADSAAE